MPSLRSTVPSLILLTLLSVLIGSAHRHTDAWAPRQVVEDELVALAEAAAEASLIEDDEAHLIGSIIELGDTIVREVMVPRPDMVTLSPVSYTHLTLPTNSRV